VKSKELVQISGANCFNDEMTKGFCGIFINKLQSVLLRSVKMKK